MSFDDDDENASGSEEENEDETMQDVGEDEDNSGSDNEDDQEEEDEGDEDEQGSEGGDDDDQEEAESPSVQRMQNRMSSRPITSPRPAANGSAAHSRHGSGNVPGAITSPSPRPSSIPFRPSIRPEAISATTYDIVPTIAAPQSTSINAVTATPDMRWVFTGGADGYIRKFNWPDSANGKLALTVAQRHPFVDSVTKAGVLLSYWENEESTNDTPSRQHAYDEPVSTSPVYSLAVHNQALWLLSGTEYGGINLQTVRHGEGSRIMTLRKHTSAVSVLHLAPDEKSVLSGSWDKTILDWDLNTGDVKRSFMGSGGQISAIQPRPQSSLPVPEELGMAIPSDTFSSNNAAQPSANGAASNAAEDTSGTGSTLQNEDGLQDAPADDDDMNSLFGDDDGDGLMGPPMQLGDADDEFSRAIAEGVPADEDGGDLEMTDAGGAVQEPEKSEADKPAEESAPTEQAAADTNGTAEGSSNTNTAQTNGMPHSIDEEAQDVKVSSAEPETDKTPSSDTTFLDACFDGIIRVWDRRKPNPIARIRPAQGTPPWCMSACWSTDGNSIYAGRRNNCVEEYSLHKGLRTPERTFKFPAGSGPVSSLAAMPNGRHLICASHDILRLYDLQAAPPSRHTPVPFLIIPGHRTGIISSLYIDPTCTFLISTAGNRGWEGTSTEVMLGYEIGVIK